MAQVTPRELAEKILLDMANDLGDPEHIESLLTEALVDHQENKAHLTEPWRCMSCRSEALEEAAKVAEDCPDENYGEDCHESIPRRIRALKAG